EIAEAENACAVRHHDDEHAAMRPVAEDLRDAPAVLRRDVEPASLPEDVRELEGGLADRRRVDERQHLVDVIDQHAIEEALVPARERLQEDVALDIARLAPQVDEHALDLDLLAADGRREEAVQLVALPFLRRERG